MTEPAKSEMRWQRKDLLGIRELSSEEITFILDTADAFKEVGTREIKKVPALRGKTLVNFFVEPSTRTRTSFEIAAIRLSADVINISASSSSLIKGETLKDTAKILEAYHADLIVLRHSSSGAPQFLAQRVKSSIINAGDGAHEHPTQALLDLYTIRSRKGGIAGLHILIIGDILFSRVARSNIFGLLKLGARVTLVGPSTLVPREFERLGLRSVTGSTMFSKPLTSFTCFGFSTSVSGRNISRESANTFGSLDSRKSEGSA
jgi:Aspartate carbamoyltransferase, catalytic chain